jgi:hypothetical protein
MTRQSVSAVQMYKPWDEFEIFVNGRDWKLSYRLRSQQRDADTVQWQVKMKCVRERSG